jgi:hypothetical protein
MKPVQIDLYVLVQNVRSNWNNWNVVTRGEAVVRLRRARLSVATLAKVVGCSETSVRRLEAVGHLPLPLKERICAGEPVYKSLASSRRSQLSERSQS